MKNSGGGIFTDGELTLHNGKIYKNWCNELGGGIYYKKTFNYNNDEINKIVYNNKAEKNGNDIYPIKIKII